MLLSVIIPAYNEEDRIVPTIENTISYLNRQHYESEIIVVSDGSTDNTKTVVDKDFSRKGRVSLHVLEYQPNRGKGYAVRYGMMRGRGDILMFMDADYSVPINYVEHGAALIQEGADIAIGSRVLSDSKVIAHQNIFREMSAKIYTFIQNRYLGISFKDTQCGFKLFKAASAKTVFQDQKLHSVIFDPEILYLAKRRHMQVTEFPVQWHHVENSRIVYDNLGKMLFIFKELFRIRRLHR
ncbi:MAG TPA: glycosyltransferase family 2 protein [Deltaproteobacteria bacterium]|nr:glycosyltransferase family 2 protein [Deltaproteobacteria bacterium]